MDRHPVVLLVLDEVVTERARPGLAGVGAEHLEKLRRFGDAVEQLDVGDGHDRELGDAEVTHVDREPGPLGRHGRRELGTKDVDCSGRRDQIVERDEHREDRDPGAKAVEHGVARRERLHRTRKLTYPGNPGAPEEVASVLADGQAIYASFEINMDVWSYKTPKPGGVIPDWQPDGTGGHAVALSGYRSTPTGRQFLVHNSWGPGWADGGYAWVSETMVRERLKDAFTVTVGDAAGNPLPQAAPPAPTPQPQLPFPFPFPLPTPAPQTPQSPQPPQASGCPAGQLRDALFGACVAACPSI